MFENPRKVFLVVLFSMFIFNQSQAQGLTPEGFDKHDGANDSEWIGFPWDRKHPDWRDWRLHVHDAIDDHGKVLLNSSPSDIKSFCPNYSNLTAGGKKMFWIHLLSSMSRFESNFDPTVKFQENFNDGNGNPVISRGLLQISKESANGYGCGISKGSQLHDADTNLSCGIRIISRWVERDGVISGRVNGKWRGGARYWAVLRTKNNFVNRIKAMTKVAEVCQ